MRFWLRWVADGVAIFLALYLVDSLLHERFHIEATWVAVVAAVVLGLADSFFRPLHRVKEKPGRAAAAVIVTIVVNALVLQLLVWTGAGLTTEGSAWILLAAAFLTLLTGLINWLIGFRQRKGPRSAVREAAAARPPAPKGGTQGKR